MTMAHILKSATIKNTSLFSTGVLCAVFPCQIGLGIPIMCHEQRCKFSVLKRNSVFLPVLIYTFSGQFEI